MPQRLPATWTGRLALLVTALGLVLMHHVVGAHQHTSADSTPVAMDHAAGLFVESSAAAASHLEPSAEAPTPHDARVHHDEPAFAGPADAPGPASGGSSALLHHHPDEGGHDHPAMLAHLCLAALLGAAVLVLLVAPSARIPAVPRPPAHARPSGAPVRTPPVPLRLAQLQVLRL